MYVVIMKNVNEKKVKIKCLWLRRYMCIVYIVWYNWKYFKINFLIYEDGEKL